MGILSFKCHVCGSKVQKIRKLKDIYSIKNGTSIICEHCKSEYAVPKSIGIIGQFYSYVFIGGLIAFVWLFLTVFLDKILGKEIANALGIWAWVLSAGVYILLELIIALILPLKLKEKKD